MALIDDFKLHQDLHLRALTDLHRGVPEGLPAQLAELTPTVAAFEEARTKIEKDANLTAIGRQNAIIEARAKATATIDTWSATKITGVDAQAAALDATLQQADAASPKPSDAAVAAMAQRLSGFDPLEVQILYSDASEAERVLIEAAAESVGRVPRRRGEAGNMVWEPVLDPDRIASVRDARRAQFAPDVAASRQDLTRIRNVYSAMASAARSLLK